MRVDLNCDLGESFGVYTIGQDEAVIPLVTSVNIACGFHAGDPQVMLKTVKLAKAHGTAIGAHPGLPDLVGFGRRDMRITPEEAYALTAYQIGALAAIAATVGVCLQHVKPHGALYNMAARDAVLAEAIATAVRDVDRNLILFGLAGSELVKAGERAGLRVAQEVFADRTYQADGTLTPRSRTDAMLHDAQEAAERVIRMLREGVVRATDGTDVPIQADTVCVHGDGPKALAFVKEIRERLQSSGVELRAVGE
ncbi:UPF0271 protein YcsF [Collibacillus ludicampi]|uniref:5-oxoprolinase subunit A n=1 Tax=Collibacillus ludicampi TaxID=2771369 RepID=A0AAV4LCH0_9BACL|nr:5-oxoprolinase subunit PxpA [Collibacillus ludicampi]GIM45512.1 UPF0271 protein YcsF [Collibacillus ludicampi]